MANLPIIPTDAELSYNGITFNSKVRSKISGVPVWDEAERAILYWKHTLKITGYISPSDYFGDNNGTDRSYFMLLRLLSQPRQLLTITKRGFIPDFSIAGDSGLNAANIDVNYGPKPRVNDWSPIGNNEGCQFSWECDFHIPECSSGAYSVQQAMEYNYEIDNAIDERGLTTRTISGHVTVPGFLVNGGIARDLETYKAVIQPDPIPRFQRTQDWKISKDRMRMDFTITDKEIGSKNAYPYNITSISCRTSLKADTGTGTIFRYWIYSFSGRASQTMDSPRDWAYKKLLDILRGRLFFIRDRLFAPIPGQPLAAPVFQQVSWDSGEEIFGLEASLNVTYVIYLIIDGNPADALRRFGFFEETTTSWEDWSVSMNLDENSAHRPRGFAGLYYNRDSDAIVDLCLPSNPKISSSMNQPQNNYLASGPSDPGDETLNGSGALIGFTNELELQTTSGKVITVPMTPGMSQVPQTARDDVHEVVMKGCALRINAAWPVPQLVTVGGKRVERVGQAKVTTRQVGIANGMPMMRVCWEIRYRLVEERVKLEEMAPPILPPAGDDFNSRFNEASGTAISPGDLADLP